jgi:hypothetical protein
MTEHELRSSEGTQVPDPRMVMVMTGLCDGTVNPCFQLKRNSTQKVIGYWLLESDHDQVFALFK